MKNSLPLIVPILLGAFALTSCNDSDFVGTAKTTLVRADDDEITNFTDGPTCLDQDKATVAPNIVVVIDNSTSNCSNSISTDCPIYTVKNGVQTQTTMRATAVENLVTSLQTVSSNEPSNSLAAANIAVTSYPSVNFSPLEKWYSVNQLNSNNLSQLLSFTNQPSGDTPLRVGMQEAYSLGQTADNTNGRKTIYVFISDGFPTDADAAATLREAQQLNASSDVFVITNTDESNFTTRSQDFYNIVRPRSYTTDAWFNSMIGTTEESGAMNVLADRHFVASSAGQIPGLLDFIVKSSGGIQCVDQ